MSDRIFYLRSRHGDLEDNVVFHNKDGCGYGTDLDNLHVFTKEEAQKELNHDIRSLPLLKSEVDALSIRAIDHQCLDVSISKRELNKNSVYVIQVTQCWNGNDIYFWTGEGRTYNYDKAKEYSFIDALQLAAVTSDRIVWSKEYLNTIARRTFQAKNINTRKMITGPGINYKKPRKKKPTTGKARGNCPDCGKITWGFDPHENDRCSNCSINRTFSSASGCY